MSTTLSPLAYLRGVWEQEELSHAEKNVLNQLVLHSNSQDIAYPGLERIARLASMRKATVGASIKTLIEKKYIERFSRHGGSGVRDAYHLLPLPEKGEKMEDAKKPPIEITHSQAPQEAATEKDQPPPNTIRTRDATAFLPPLPTDYTRMPQAINANGANGHKEQSEVTRQRLVQLFQKKSIRHDIIVSVARNRGYTLEEIEEIEKEAKQ